MLPNFMPMLANFVPMVPNFVPILLPNFVLMLPNFVPMLPNFVPILLPNFVLMLPNFVPMLPNFAGASFLRNGVFERRGPDVPHTSERSLRRKAREVLFGGDHARPAVPAQARWVDSTNRKSSSDRSRTVAHFCRNITGPAFWVRVSKKWPLQVQPLLTVPNERSVRLSCFLVVLDQRPFHCCFGPNTIPLFFGPKTIPLLFWTKDHSIVFWTKYHSIVFGPKTIPLFLTKDHSIVFWTKDHSVVVLDQRPFHSNHLLNKPVLGWGEVVLCGTEAVVSAETRTSAFSVGIHPNLMCRDLAVPLLRRHFRMPCENIHRSTTLFGKDHFHFLSRITVASGNSELAEFLASRWRVGGFRCVGVSRQRYRKFWFKLVLG